MSIDQALAPAPVKNVFVLSAGGARGAAQVGMLRALLGAGVVPHAFVGCSVGALNAAFLACEATAARVEVLADSWTRMRTSDIFGGNVLTKLGHVLRRRPYLYSNDGLARLIRDWAGVDRIEELPTPLRVVTTALGTGRAVYHDVGCLRDVLLASTALPALFPPVELVDPVAGTQATHIDGAVADIVPTAGAVGLGATHVYVLDATIPPPTSPPRSPLDVLVASLGIATRIRPHVEFGDSVTVTHIRTADDQQTGLTSFDWSRQLIEWGEAAAHRALDALLPCPAVDPLAEQVGVPVVAGVLADQLLQVPAQRAAVRAS
jgi:NTE family protein